MTKLPAYKQGQVLAVKRLRRGMGNMVVASKRREIKAAALHGPASKQAEKAVAERIEFEGAYKLMARYMANRLRELEG
jgi:hypothetical protein